MRLVRGVLSTCLVNSYRLVFVLNACFLRGGWRGLSQGRCDDASPSLHPAVTSLVQWWVYRQAGHHDAQLNAHIWKQQSSHLSLNNNNNKTMLIIVVVIEDTSGIPSRVSSRCLQNKTEKESRRCLMLNSQPRWSYQTKTQVIKSHVEVQFITHVEYGCIQMWPRQSDRSRTERVSQ